METIDAVVYGVKTKCVKHDTLICEDWFAFKKWQEICEKYNRKFDGFDTRVYAIVGETEKAYNVILGTAFHHIATWCPKSLVSIDNEPKENDMTLVCDYKTAMEAMTATREFFE